MTGKRRTGCAPGTTCPHCPGMRTSATGPGTTPGITATSSKCRCTVLSTGLEFNTAGAEKEGIEQRLSYVGVPINNRLKLGILYFDLGLDVAFKVGEKTLVNGTEVDLGEDNEAETLDVLAHAGAGIKFLFLGAEVRYRYGLTEAYEGYRNTGLEIGLTTFF